MKSFFKALKPLILEVGDELSVKEFKELAEKTDELGNKYGEAEEPTIETIPLDDYYMTARPYNVWANRDALTDMEKNDKKVFIPSYLKKKPVALRKLYDAVYIDGVIYHESHDKVERARDTDKLDHKDNLYHVIGRGWYESKKGLVYLDHLDGWVRKKDVVMTEDIGKKFYKGDCYHYQDSDGNVKYYRFRDLSPDAPQKAARYEAAKFPKPEDINEIRIGIELEYHKAIQASREVLKKKHLRDRWNSVRDGSIQPDGYDRMNNPSTEFVSVPFKYDELEDEVINIMQLVRRHGAKFNDDCGFHVHIGSPNLKFKQLTGLVQLCKNLEEDLFRLMPDYRQNNEFCKKLDSSFNGFDQYAEGEIKDEEVVADIFYEGKASYKSRKKQSKWRVDEKRHYWLSVDRFWYYRDQPHKKTAEFRMHHATHDYDQFLQFIKLCYYITKYAINNSIKKCKSSGLKDVINSIKNRRDQEQVRSLLKTKQIINR